MSSSACPPASPPTRRSRSVGNWLTPGSMWHPCSPKGSAISSGKTTFDALASEPAQSSLWDEASPIPHTKLGQRADLIVVAPATADLVARYAHGLADDLLTTTLVATRAPVVLCPAMHTEMWEHPAVQQNLDTLRGRGVIVVPPEEGRLAGGDSGTGRLADPSVIVETVLRALGALRRGGYRGRRGWRGSSRSRRAPGTGDRRGDQGADRPRALRHQPFFGQAGSRLGRSGSAAWCRGRPHHHHEARCCPRDRHRAGGNGRRDGTGRAGPGRRTPTSW